MYKNNFIIESFQALGTLWYVECFEDLNDSKKLEIKNYLECYILDFQNKYSRFLESSILNKYNRGEIRLELDEDLKNMIEMGEKFSIETDGVFDLKIKNKLEDRGYGVKQHVEASLSNEEAAFKNVDLGGIGKGYLIDKLKSILEEKFSLKYFLVNGGGDIYVTSNNEKEIELFLQNPVEDDKYIGSIKLKNKSFCCSSSFKRHWVQNGIEQNHFVADKHIVAASYVIGDSATEADVYATILCILSDDIEKLERVVKGKSLKNSKIEYLIFDKNADKIMSENFKNFIYE